MVLQGWREGGARLALLLLGLLLLSNSAEELLGWCGPVPRVPRVEGGGERSQVLATITGHCLPKLVCQLHALENTQHISDSERNLIALVG
jgi:hypothetical protein